MDISFRTIGEKALKDFYTSTMSKIPSSKCEDEYVGKISTFRTKQKDFERTPIKEIVTRGECLIMILESPHADEFKEVIGPAKGATGSSIRAHIRRALKCISPEKFDLILLNAVQYQCSLGISTDCVRDDVFLEIWNNQGGKENFRLRLNQVARAGDVIVNCCTVGNAKLRYLVQAEINDMRPTLEAKGVSSFKKRTHPSSWGRSGKRELDKDWV